MKQSIYDSRFKANAPDADYRVKCMGKHQYPTRKEARDWRFALVQQLERKLRVYKCPYCGFWHLGGK